MSRTIEVVVEVRVQVEASVAGDDSSLARTIEREVQAACNAKAGLRGHFDIEAMSWDEVKHG